MKKNQFFSLLRDFLVKIAVLENLIISSFLVPRHFVTVVQQLVAVLENLLIDSLSACLIFRTNNNVIVSAQTANYNNVSMPVSWTKAISNDCDLLPIYTYRSHLCGQSFSVGSTQISLHSRTTSGRHSDAFLQFKSLHLHLYLC